MDIYSRKPRKCPCCKHTPLSNIFYGFPAMSKKMMDDLDSKKIILGGCEIYADSSMPKWQCSECETEFYQRKEVEACKDTVGNITSN